jgi:hypothetical protein
MAMTRLLTANDLWQLQNSDQRFALIEGELVPMAPPGRSMQSFRLHSVQS